MRGLPSASGGAQHTLYNRALGVRIGGVGFLGTVGVEVAMPPVLSLLCHQVSLSTHCGCDCSTQHLADSPDKPHPVHVLHRSPDGATAFSPTLQMGKLRHRKASNLSRSGIWSWHV